MATIALEQARRGRVMSVVADARQECRRIGMHPEADQEADNRHKKQNQYIADQVRRCPSGQQR